MNRFKKAFDSYVCFGDTITAKVDGLTVTARVEQDCDMGPPWEEHDGHGPVSEWTSRDKESGEVVLHSDRGSYRYYDWKEAIKIAKRDGWDAPPYKTGTKGQQAERAVKADFENLQAWCRDEWHWGIVVLCVSKDGVELDDYAACCGGTEVNYPGGDNSHLAELANELLDEAVEAGKAVLAKLRTDGTCPHCGEGVLGEWEYCPDCGQHIGTRQAAAV